MGKRLTQLEVQNRIYQKNAIKIIGNYINTHSHVLCQCQKCGYEWSPTPDKLMQGKGCPSCSKKLKGTTESVSKLFKEKGFTLLEKYINRNTPVLTKCDECGHIWKVRPYDLIYKQGCPKCNKCAKLTTEEFKIRMNKINPNLEIIGEYINSNSKIKCKCKICGYQWEATPNNLSGGKTGCPKCKQSKGERIINNYLTNINIKFEDQYKIPISKSINASGIAKIDFYLPDYNLFIEYNGEQHYIPLDYFGGKLRFEKQKERDEYVRNYCKENNINLLEIRYDENIEEKLDEYFRKQGLIK